MVLPENDHATSFHMKTRQVLIPVSVSPSATLAEKIVTILKAAKVDFEPFWPGLFAKCLETISIKDLITNIGSGAGPAQAAPAGGDASPTGGDAAPAKEEKKEEPEEESDDDMGFGLFD